MYTTCTVGCAFEHVVAKRQGRRDRTSASPNAAREASPLRLQKTSHRKDAHGRQTSSSSPTAVQAHAQQSTLQDGTARRRSSIDPVAVAHVQHATVQNGTGRRRSSISPVAVKSREEYTHRRRQSLAHALGEYEDEERQEQQEQDQMKPEPEEASIRDANHKNSKKHEHAGNPFYFISLSKSMRLYCPCSAQLIGIINLTVSMFVSVAAYSICTPLNANLSVIAEAFEDLGLELSDSD